MLGPVDLGEQQFGPLSSFVTKSWPADFDFSLFPGLAMPEIGTFGHVNWRSKRNTEGAFCSMHGKCPVNYNAHT